MAANKKNSSALFLRTLLHFKNLVYCIFVKNYVACIFPIFSYGLNNLVSTSFKFCFKDGQGNIYDKNGNDFMEIDDEDSNLRN